MRNLKKHEDIIDTYNQAQAAVRKVIYRTIDKTTFLQVKNEVDAASMWRKVASIHADKGTSGKKEISYGSYLVL